AIEIGVLVALVVGAVCGVVNGFFISYLGLPSLAVTLAGLIGYRGIASILVEDRSVTLPQYFNDFGLKPLVGPLPASLIIFFAMAALFIVLLKYTAFGRYVYIIGSNREAARFSGVNVRR